MRQRIQKNTKKREKELTIIDKKCRFLSDFGYWTVMTWNVRACMRERTNQQTIGKGAEKEYEKKLITRDNLTNYGDGGCALSQQAIQMEILFYASFDLSIKHSVIPNDILERSTISYF